jgi:hypothetical protein
MSDDDLITAMSKMGYEPAVHGDMHWWVQSEGEFLRRRLQLTDEVLELLRLIYRAGLEQGSYEPVQDDWF